jgi:hypothetical protein
MIRPNNPNWRYTPSQPTSTIFPDPRFTGLSINAIIRGGLRPRCRKYPMATRRAIQVGSQGSWDQYLYCCQLVCLPFSTVPVLQNMRKEANIRSSNLIVGATFLSLMRIASPAGAFGIYAIFCVGSWVFCWNCYPETSG